MLWDLKASQFFSFNIKIQMRVNGPRLKNKGKKNLQKIKQKLPIIHKYTKKDDLKCLPSKTNWQKTLEQCLWNL